MEPDADHGSHVLANGKPHQFGHANANYHALPIAKSDADNHAIAHNDAVPKHDALPVIDALPLNDSLPESVAKPVAIAKSVALSYHLALSNIDVMRADQALGKLLEHRDIQTVLDVGCGNGEHARAMRECGLDVTTNSLGADSDLPGRFEDWEFSPDCFDAIWACHVLEHVTDVGAFLRKCFNILRDGGVLAITVPPLKYDLVGGHVNLFTPASLCYSLILAGFDCREASVATYGYNISVLVRKVKAALPELVMDNGDISRLARFFPWQVKHGIDGRLPNVRWGPKRAIALVPRVVIESELKPLFERKCAEIGIDIEFHNITGDCSQWVRRFKEFGNVITWNCKLPHVWMQSHRKNVLYIENSLLSQGAGVFVDNHGFFSESNLCIQRAWEQEYPVDLDAFVRERLKWTPFSGGDPGGPILVCLQNNSDSNLRMEFPFAGECKDKILATIEIAKRYLPAGVPVIVRPHPRFLDDFESRRHRYDLPRGWTVSTEGTFTELLPKCRALVAVNSTCISEATTLALPIATLGTGAFTGSGTTLECATDPSRLSGLLDWQPDKTACRRYATAILGRHFIAYHSPQANNPELEAWLAAAR